ncbi:hypothetical protein CEXT_12701 [Caerostris extrusa]|uniref:Uncharacterized protein n=1 Tax=Caerostris extrusa TaxID=172846 RepID=A0AAV4VZF2_CAEEX|nr:hypothetical protein CEXT_12701 [Caerostris extrusa]
MIRDSGKGKEKKKKKKTKILKTFLVKEKKKETSLTTKRNQRGKDQVLFQVLRFFLNSSFKHLPQLSRRSNRKKKKKSRASCFCNNFIPNAEKVKRKIKRASTDGAELLFFHAHKSATQQKRACRRCCHRFNPKHQAEMSTSALPLRWHLPMLESCKWFPLRLQLVQGVTVEVIQGFANEMGGIIHTWERG